MRISDWSSDVCSSDLPQPRPVDGDERRDDRGDGGQQAVEDQCLRAGAQPVGEPAPADAAGGTGDLGDGEQAAGGDQAEMHLGDQIRSEEHTSELQSLMRISYDGFCLKKKK